MKIVAALVAFALPAMAHAAHPFVTEDPGTQGAGKVELELGFGAFRGDPSIPGRNSIFSPQLSVGASESVDLIAQVARVEQTATGEPTVIGLGGTLLDLKWRFKETDDYALGVRAGLDLPSGDGSDGVGSDTVGAHAIGIVSLAFGVGRVRQRELRVHATARDTPQPPRGLGRADASGRPAAARLRRGGGVLQSRPGQRAVAGVRTRGRDPDRRLVARRRRRRAAAPDAGGGTHRLAGRPHRPLVEVRLALR
jgi:hypothetical protein